MQGVADILNSTGSWEKLSERQARETRRTVYLVDGRYILKKFEVPLNVSSYRRPWVIEDRALRRLSGFCAPRTLGFVEREDAGQRVFWLAKEHLDGTVVKTLSIDDMKSAAAVLAGIHSRLIITDDANAQNFIRRPDGSFCFLDFGRARNFILRSPWFFLSVGWELAKFYREGIQRDRAKWRSFLSAYRSAARCPPFTWPLIRASCATSNATRSIRKLAQGKSPWS